MIFCRGLQPALFLRKNDSITNWKSEVSRVTQVKQVEYNSPYLAPISHKTPNRLLSQESANLPFLVNPLLGAGHSCFLGPAGMGQITNLYPRNPFVTCPAGMGPQVSCARERLETTRFRLVKSCRRRQALGECLAAIWTRKRKDGEPRRSRAKKLGACWGGPF